MFRHWKLAVSIAGILALTGLGVGLVVGLSGAPVGTVTPAATLTTPQQIHLEQEITAPTVTSQAGVVAVEVRHQFEHLGKSLLPFGSHLAINRTTFRALSAQLATVDATVSGPSPGRWQLVLVRESDQWLLLGTRKLS